MLTEATFPYALESQRLLLRQYGADDAIGLLQLVAGNRDRLMQNFPGMAQTLVDANNTRRFIAEKAEECTAKKAFCYGTWLKSTSELIGQTYVKNVAREVPSAELSYFIDGSSQRQGFASEAISEILCAAFKQLQFQRIFVRIIPSNGESISLAKKLGFKLEGLQRNEFRCGFGKLHNNLYFSLTSGDFRSL